MRRIFFREFPSKINSWTKIIFSRKLWFRVAIKLSMYPLLFFFRSVGLGIDATRAKGNGAVNRTKGALKNEAGSIYKNPAMQSWAHTWFFPAANQVVIKKMSDSNNTFIGKCSNEMSISPDVSRSAIPLKFLGKIQSNQILTQRVIFSRKPTVFFFNQGVGYAHSCNVCSVPYGSDCKHFEHFSF